MKKVPWLFCLIILVACAPAATPTPTSTPCRPCPTPTCPPLTAPPTPEPTLGKIYSPFKLEEEGSVYDAENEARLAVKITQAVRGDEAWQMIQEANIANEPPSLGKEYLVAYVIANYLEGPQGQSYKINPFDFNYLDERLRLLQPAHWVIVPEPRLSDVSPVYAGKPMEGWLAFEIPTGDDNLMVAFGLDRLELEAVWFRLSRCKHWPVC